MLIGYIEGCIEEFFFNYVECSPLYLYITFNFRQKETSMHSKHGKIINRLDIGYPIEGVIFYLSVPVYFQDGLYINFGIFYCLLK